MDNQNIYNQKQVDEEESGITLKDIFYIIKKNIIVILSIIVAVLIVGSVYTFKIQICFT